MDCENLDPAKYSPRAIEGFAFLKATQEIVDLKRRHDAMIDVGEAYPELSEIPKECIPALPVLPSEPAKEKKKRDPKTILLIIAAVVGFLAVLGMNSTP